MADITVTAGSVLAYEGVPTEGIAGAATTAGQAVYFDTSTSTWKLAVTTTAATAGSGGVGIALNGAGIGQPLHVLQNGIITIGATVAVGTIYCVSDNAGGIAPSTDNGSGDFRTILGVAITTGRIKLACFASGIAIA